MSIIDKICQLVSEFNYLFGVIDYSYTPGNDLGIKVNKFDAQTPDFNQKQIELRYGLIAEECEELSQALEQKNKIEIADALCDILYVIAGAKVYFNLPNNQININLQKSNLEIKMTSETYPSTITQFEIAELILEDDLKFSEIKQQVSMINLTVQQLKNITNQIISLNNNILLDDIIVRYNLCLDYLIFYVVELANKLGFKIFRLFELVHESNMSKVCDNFQLAIKSVEYYKTVEKRYSSPDFREIIYNEKKYWVIYDNETKKILKSIEYKPVNFFE